MSISKSISADAEREMHKAKALATVETNAEIAKRAKEYEANAATAAAAAENAAQLSEMLERKRSKKRAYKLAATEAKEELIKLRSSSRARRSTAIGPEGAQDIRRERGSADKAYAQRDGARDALKQAMRDYRTRAPRLKT